MLRRLGVATLFALVLLPNAGFGQWPPAPRDEWDAELSIHGWLWSSAGTAEVFASGSSATVDATFGGMGGPFGPGASVRFETKTSLSALMAGATFLYLDQEGEVESHGETAHGDLNTTQLILDAGAGYRLASSFEILGTARYYWIFINSQFGSVTTEDEDRAWMDVFLGGRISRSSGPVTLSIRGDIGAGGSDFAWFGNAVLAYRTGARSSLRAEYRILSADRGGVQPSNHLGWDVMQSGFGLGIGLDL